MEKNPRIDKTFPAPIDDGMGALFECKNKIVQGEKQFTPVIHPDINEL